MNRKTASAALSALLFAQGLLGVGAVAATLLHRPAPQPMVAEVAMPSSSAVR